MHDSRQSARCGLITAAAVGVVACVLADMVHEALGHGVVSWIVGDRVLAISTVALQSADASRAVAAAGTVANCVVGALALVMFRRARAVTASSLFLWLFAAFNLFNSGYLVASALMKAGDWAVVIAGLAPVRIWRFAIGAAGALVYVLSVRWCAGSMVMVARRGGLPPRPKQLALAAYVAAGVVMTAASVLNPIGPQLILPSGVGPSFGLNAGLLFAMGAVDDRLRDAPVVQNGLRLSWGWTAAAIAVGGIFIAVLGPGIRFTP
jgi:hypothetical protein